jgi:hypothetical protein
MPRTRGDDRRRQIPDMVSHVRPPEVNDRVPGHWEVTSSKAQATSLRWACWSNARAVWCCWPGWTTRRPPRRSRASLQS